MSKPSIMRFVAKLELEQAIKDYCDQKSEETGERVTYAEVTRQLWAKVLKKPKLAEGYKTGRPFAEPSK